GGCDPLPDEKIDGRPSRSWKCARSSSKNPASSNQAFYRHQLGRHPKALLRSDRISSHNVRSQSHLPYAIRWLQSLRPQGDSSHLRITAHPSRGPPPPRTAMVRRHFPKGFRSKSKSSLANEGVV